MKPTRDFLDACYALDAESACYLAEIMESAMFDDFGRLTSYLRQFLTARMAAFERGDEHKPALPDTRGWHKRDLAGGLVACMHLRRLVADPLSEQFAATLTDIVSFDAAALLHKAHQYELRIAEGN